MKTEYYISSPDHGVLALRNGSYVWTASGKPTVWFKRATAEKVFATIVAHFPGATIKSA